MADNFSFFGKLISQTSEKNINIYIFEDESGAKHKVSIDMKMQDDWVANENGVYIAEMTDTSRFGENPKESCGFELYWNKEKNKLVFNISNSDRINIGMLKSISEVDPVSALTYQKV